VCADFLVIECWGDVVAFGGGVEGQQFSGFGCTFRVVSTVQLAWDGHAGDLTHAVFTGAKNLDQDVLILLCSQESGPLATPSTTFGNANVITIQGQEHQWNKIDYWLDVGSRGRQIKFKDVELKGAGNNRTIDSSITTETIFLERVRFPSVSKGPRISNAPLFARDCEFASNQAGGFWALDMDQNPQESHLYDCKFDDAVRSGRELHLHSPTFYPGVHGTGVIVENNGVGQVSLSVDNPTFDSGGGLFTNYFHLQRPSLVFKISNVVGHASCTGAGLVIGSSFVTNGVRQFLSGVFGTSLVIDNQSETECYLDAFISCHLGTANGNPKVAQGRFNNSHFLTGPAKGYVDFTLVSGMRNEVDGLQFGDGPPTHIAVEGVEYVDWTANTFYRNSSDRFGSTWTLMGSYAPGSGPVSPSEPFVVHASAPALPNSRILGVTPPITLDLATPGQATVGHGDVGVLPDAHHLQLHGITDHTVDIIQQYVMLASAGPLGYAQTIP
jgi:hypothetical protein